MTTKNYNINSESGVDDMDVIEGLGVEHTHAYQPSINEAAINEVKKRNFDSVKARVLSEGKSVQEAEKQAKRMADKGEKETRTRLAKVQKKRGYK